jgi:hypothetical protein
MRTSFAIRSCMITAAVLLFAGTTGGFSHGTVGCGVHGVLSYLERC